MNANNLIATLQQLAAGIYNNWGKTTDFLQQLQKILQQGRVMEFGSYCPWNAGQK